LQQAAESDRDCGRGLRRQSLAWGHPSEWPALPTARVPLVDFIMRNAMDSQEVAIGWWPGDPRYGRAAFYAYAHPAPNGFADGKLTPATAR
jgi:Family of unknown function (DUF5996)